MRNFLDVAWVAGSKPKARVVCFALAFAIPLLATGCGKKNDASTPNAAPTASNSNAEESAAADAVNLQPLNRALIEWRMQNHRVPANFEEFAASANTNIPPPPPGKKYVINSQGLISLVNANQN